MHSDVNVIFARSATGGLTIQHSKAYYTPHRHAGPSSLFHFLPASPRAHRPAFFLRCVHVSASLQMRFAAASLRRPASNYEPDGA